MRMRNNGSGHIIDVQIRMVGMGIEADSSITIVGDHPGNPVVGEGFSLTLTADEIRKLRDAMIETGFLG